MKAYITTCCKEKRIDRVLLPAIERYISDRINWVSIKSKEDGASFYIFSGNYGLLAPSDKIPFYDKTLQEHEVEKMIDLLQKQIRGKKYSSYRLFLKNPNEDPSWRPYVSTLQKSLEQLQIPYEIEWVS